MSTLLKITYGTDIRRLTLKTEPSYPELQNFIKSLYAADVPNVFVIKYLDDEGDKISITNKQELSEAWEFARNHGAILRMTIEAKATVPAPEKPKEEAAAAPAPNLGNLVDEALRLPEVQTFLGALNLDPRTIRPTIDNFLGAFVPEASTCTTSSSEETKESEEKVVHAAICDACNQRIVGIRYKCTSCPDYDLCEACEPNSQTVHDATHTFLKIRRPTGPHPYFRRWGGRCRRSQQQGEECPARGTWGNGCGRRRRWAQCQRQQHQEKEGCQTPAGAAPTGCPFFQRYQSRFISDVTVEDGTQFAAGASFVKIWKMRNIGSTAWPEPTRLVFVGGDTLTNTEAVIVPSIQPNEEVDITVDMLAPSSPGRYVSKFRLCTPEGTRFGHCVWADITVVESKAEPQEKAPEPAIPVVSTPVEPPKQEVPVTVSVEKKEEKKEEKKDDEEGFAEVIDQLAGMGFVNRELSLRLLKANNGDVLLTVHQLLSL